MGTFDILRERCGLSQTEAAGFLGVPIELVGAWSAGHSAMTPALVSELRGLYRKIVHTGRDLGEHLRIRLEQQAQRHIEIGLARDDGDALACGFPCVGAHAAAVGIALMLLPDDVTFDLVPRHGDVPTAIAQHAGAIHQRLSAARAKRDAIEQRLATHDTFRDYCAATTDDARAPLEAALRGNPDFIEWLAFAMTIRELETLAKSTGTGPATTS